MILGKRSTHPLTLLHKLAGKILYNVATSQQGACMLSLKKCQCIKDAVEATCSGRDEKLGQ